MGRFNGRKMASWAKNHAQEPQPILDGCALFFSLAAWEGGGLLRTKQWTDEGRRGQLPGTPQATLVHELMAYLQRHKHATVHEVYRWSMEDRSPNPVVSGVKLGDGFAYDYGYGTGFRHIAVVTGHTQGIPLVSEWGTTDRIGERCSYRQRRWHYSQRSREPMAEKYPELRVVHLRMA